MCLAAKYGDGISFSVAALLNYANLDITEWL